jgi:hypothetical protein
LWDLFWLKKRELIDFHRMTFLGGGRACM